jgi:hypothetical protein
MRVLPPFRSRQWAALTIVIALLAAGLWIAAPARAADQTTADLVARLRAAGASVDMAEGVSLPVFAAPGRTLHVDGATVTVFSYRDAGAAADEAARIAPDGNAIGATRMPWAAPPHFYLDGRLLVLYVGDDSGITGLLTDLLGPPVAGQ